MGHELDPSEPTQVNDETLGHARTWLPGHDETLAADETRPNLDDSRDAAIPRNIGRYIVLEQLGAGGMGVVVSAYDPKLDRRVAIKLIHAPRRDASDHRLRMEREAQAMAKLSHPNVVTVYEVGEHDGQLFVAMEFVAGQDLRKWLGARDDPDDWRATLDMFLQAGRGLAAAHEAGLIHRDFKPDNVFVGDDGRARVGDFGLVRRDIDVLDDASDPSGAGGLASSELALARQLTQTGAAMGTPGYMAPEQFEGGPTDARTDQFAYCVALWEALYGRRPFEGRTMAELILNVCEGQRVPAPAASRVPAWLREVIERGLSTAPADRYPTIEQLLAALQADPTRRRRIWLGVAMAALALGGWLGVRDLLERRTLAACEAEGASMAEIWTDDARTRLREAMVATEVAYAGSTADRSVALLDVYAQAWQRARTQACTNARIDMSWDAETHERARWCLDERKLVFEATLDELEHADVDSMQEAVIVAAGLEHVDGCLDAKRLQASPPPPDDREGVLEVMRALARASALASAAKYEDSLALTEQALLDAERIDWPPLLATAKLARAQQLEQIGRYPEAEAGYEDAYFGAFEAGALDSAAEAAVGLAYAVGYQQSRHADGLRWARQADVLLSLRDIDEHAWQRSATNNARALVYDSMGDYARAEALFERALEINERTLGPRHPDLAVDLSNLARMHTARADHEGARELWQRALDITEAALGADHPHVGYYLDGLGRTYAAVGDDQRALVMHERSLALRQRELPPLHPEIATAMANLASIHETLGDHAKAIALNERALELRESNFGPDHRLVAISLANLARVHVATGDYARAEPLDRRALEIREQTFGPMHPSVGESLAELAKVEAALGRPSEARAHFERALAVLEAALGPTHPQLGAPLIGLARLALAEAQPAEAMALAERAAALLDEAQVPAATLAEARFVLAQALWDTQHERAVELVLQCQDALVGVAGAEPLRAEIDGFVQARGGD